MTIIPLMNRRRFCATLLFMPFVGGCAPFVREGYFFGARVRMTIPNGESVAAASAATGEIFANFADSHRRFHAWRNGETAALNAAIAKGRLPAPLSLPMEKMLRFCADAEEMSEGLFNPAIGEIVRRWGFHRDIPGEQFAPPPESFIRAMTADPPSLRGMEIRDNALYRIHPRARLDFGAVAKGAALDDARAILRRRGVYGALLDIGGNILALGANGNRKWRIALDFGLENGGGAPPHLLPPRLRHPYLLPPPLAPSLFTPPSFAPSPFTSPPLAGGTEGGRETDDAAAESQTDDAAAANHPPFFHGRIIHLQDGEAIATSGASRRFFIHAGRRYHHLIDPRSARPARRPKTAAVISADSQFAGALSDAAATALALADDEAGRIIANFALAAAAAHPPSRLWGDMESRLRQ